MSRRPIPPARALAMLAVLALLAGCSTLSPYSRLTKLDLALSAGERVNPDLNGRPSPVVVRLFELKHPVAFENADFFSLYERPKETLDPDLVTSEELELRPGERVELKLSVEEGPLRGRARRLPRSRRGKLALRGAGHGERADPGRAEAGSEGHPECRRTARQGG